MAHRHRPPRPTAWRNVFWTLTGITVLMFLVALFFIPETLPKERRQPGGAAATIKAVRPVLTDRAYVGYTHAYVGYTLD